MASYQGRGLHGQIVEQMGVRIVGGLQVYARVLNLANRAYEETLGFPALGRSGIVGVRIAASR